MPEYPLEARQRHATGAGIFVLRVQVKSGRVKEVEVARSTGHAILDAAAVKALKKWRFKPGAPLGLIKDILPDRKDPFAAEDSLIKAPVSFDM
jgi:TonB family protein